MKKPKNRHRGRHPAPPPSRPQPRTQATPAGSATSGVPGFVFRPVDTLFFRDGRPFNQEDEGMAEVRSVFPPFPSVLAGAFRAAAARRQGWRDGGSWASLSADDGRAFTDALGDGPEMEGATQLRFGPPAVLRGDDKTWGRLYPVPLHLLGKVDDKGELIDGTLLLLRPAAEIEALNSDLGATRFPIPPCKLDGEKPLTRHWLTAAGMGKIRRGVLPVKGELVSDRTVCGQEFRVGLERDPGRHAAKHGMLYAATHARLCDGVLKGEPARQVALGVRVEGLPAGWEPKGLHPLGGFQRLAEIVGGSWQEAEAPKPDGLPTGGRVRYVVVLTSPALLACEWAKPGGRLCDLPGRIVSACVERPVWIGGWDGRRPRDGGPFRGPTPLQPCLPAGSVWFMDEAPRAEVASLLTGGRPAIGARTCLGFGEYLIGLWPDEGKRR